MTTKEITQEQVREWFNSAIEDGYLPADCTLTFEQICERLKDDTAIAPNSGPRGMGFSGDGLTYAEAVREEREAEEDAAARHKEDLEEDAQLEARTALSVMSGDSEFDALDEGDRGMARRLAIDQLCYDAAVRERAAELLENEEDKE